MLFDSRRTAFGDAFGNEKLRVLGPAILRLGQTDFLRTKRRTVYLGRILHVRTAKPNVISHADKRRFFVLRFGKRDGGINRIEIGTVLNFEHIPVMRLKPGTHILGKRHIRRPVDRDVVVVIKNDEF